MEKENLLIVWSSADKEVALQFPLLYGSVILERGYWSKAHLMLWGPSIRLVLEDSKVKKQLKKVQESGVDISACVVCVEEYDGVKEFKEMDISVVHTGEMLTHALKDATWSVLTV